MDEEQLQRIYDAHRDRGASEAEALAAVELARSGSPVDRAIPRPGSGGAVSTDQATRITNAIDQRAQQKLEAQLRLSADGGSAAGDFGRMATQGATFGFADEITGLAGGDTDASRQRIADLRQLAPGASVMSEIAGGVALPVFAGGQAMRGGGGVLRAGGAGALGGTVQGGLTATGEAEGSLAERLPEAGMGALKGAGLGAVLGTLPPLANAFARGSRGVPMRLTDLLRSTTGVEDDLARAASRAQLKESVAGAELGALDAANPSITDPRVLAALDGSNNRFMDRAVNSVEPGGFGASKAPSLAQIRTVRQELADAASRAAKKPRTTIARGYRGARNDLTDAVDDAVPGFKDANRAFAQTQSRIEGLGFKSQQGKLIPKGGNRLSTKTADEGRIALEGQYPEMQEGMRTRFVNDVASEIEGGGGAWLKGMVERNPQIVAKLRNAFPDSEAGSASFKELVRELALEQSAARTRALGVGAGKVGAVLGAGTAGIYGLRALLGGGSGGRP